jgi:hypothetical protein
LFAVVAASAACTTSSVSGLTMSAGMHGRTRRRSRPRLCLDPASGLRKNTALFEDTSACRQRGCRCTPYSRIRTVRKGGAV